jgi:hypothetical protein
MPGYLLHAGAIVLCAHGGQAQPTSPFPRVMVGGQPVVTQSAPYVVAGCPLVPPPIPPCVTAQWVTGAMRVKAGGLPVLLQDSQSLCTPTGTPLSVVTTQFRVKGM